jgi:hypothetical protein
MGMAPSDNDRPSWQKLQAATTSNSRRGLLPICKHHRDRQFAIENNLGLGRGGFPDQIDSVSGVGVLWDRSASITRIWSANASASCKMLKSPMRFMSDGPVTLTWKPWPPHP